MKTVFTIAIISMVAAQPFMLPAFAQESPVPRQPDYVAQENIEEVLRDIEEEYQPLHGALIEVQQVNEEMYRHILEEFSHHWVEFKRLQQENAELADLEVQTRTIEIRLQLFEGQYHQTQSKEKKAEAKAKIQAQLDELFEVKVAKRQMEIARLEEELQQLKSELDEIVQHKADHIQRRLDQMTQGDVFSW